MGVEPWPAFHLCGGRCWGRRSIFPLVSNALLFITDCSNFSTLSILASHWSFLLSYNFLTCGWQSHLGLVKWVVPFVTFAMLASEDSGPAVWSFPLGLTNEMSLPIFLLLGHTSGGESFLGMGLGNEPNWRFYHTCPSRWYGHYRTDGINKGEFLSAVTRTPGTSFSGQEIEWWAVSPHFQHFGIRQLTMIAIFWPSTSKQLETYGNALRSIIISKLHPRCSDRRTISQNWTR